VRKWVFRRPVLRRYCAVFTFCLVALFASVYAQVSTSALERAQADLVRIKALVEEGSLPKSSIAAAEERVADAQDELTLAETLYSPTRLQDTTPQQADEMVAAATRRVDRAAAKMEERHKLLDMGIISQSEMASVKSELYARQLVLDLAKSRAKLLDDLRQMAVAEQRVELPTIRNSMIRYDGSVAFKMADLPVIEKEFKARFNHDLPVSAIGQTAVHQGLGLDHRNKVDVALNPEQPEGLWLRHYLEKAHVSYLAFHAAVAGAATGAHIHIGSGSSRLVMPGR
jgi:hypothetical protein